MGQSFAQSVKEGGLIDPIKGAQKPAAFRHRRRAERRAFKLAFAIRFTYKVSQG
jgi:hypothetical protein